MRHALALCVLMASSLAAAANPKAGALAREAEQLYREAKFTQAADLLRQAYDVEPNPKFLFNRARALEQAGDTAVALETYREYIALPADETEPELVIRAQETIDERTRPKDAPRKAAPTHASPPSTKPTKEAVPTTTAKAVGDQPAKDHPVSNNTTVAVPTAPTGRSKVPALVVSGLGVAALGVGVTFGLLANGARAQFSTATTLRGKIEFEAATRRDALVADLSLLVGVAAATVGIVLFARSDEPVSVAVTPTRQGATVAVGWSW